MQKDLLRETKLSLLGPHALASSLSVQWGHGDCARPRVVLPGPGLLPRCLPAGAHSTLTPCGARRPTEPQLCPGEGRPPCLPLLGLQMSSAPATRHSHFALHPRAPASQMIIEIHQQAQTQSREAIQSFFCPQHLLEHLRGSGVKCRPSGVHRSSLAICSCKTRVKHRGQSLVWM